MKILNKIILLAFCGLILVNCKKDHKVLGTDVQPGEDGLNTDYLHALPVTAHTIAYDSIVCFNDRYKYIGSNYDPHFGKTDIGLYLNANMNVTDLKFGTTSTLTSAEIILAIDNFEYSGEKNAALTYSVFLVNTPLSPSTYYFTNNNRLYDPAPLPTVTTGTFIAGTGTPYIKINVDKAFAEALFQDTMNLASNKVFQAKYKGFYIAASIGSGNTGIIYRTNVEDDLSGFYLHYKKANVAADTTFDFKFTFSGSDAVRFNTVKFVPTQDLNSQLQGDTTLGRNNLFLKGMGHTKLKVQIPFLKNYSDSFKVAVNRAELIFYVDPSLQSGAGEYAAPLKLSLFAMDSIGREIFVEDQRNSTDYIRYDGNYDALNKRYVFNIARHAQAILKGELKNHGFYLAVANTDITLRTVYAGNSKDLFPVRRDNYIDRVILAGSNNINQALRPTFNLSYIKFKND